MSESEHTASYELPILSERRVYDDIMNDKFIGCIQGVRICECKACTPTKRATCAKPKTFQERFGFDNYREMLDA